MMFTSGNGINTPCNIVLGLFLKVEFIQPRIV